MTTGGAAVPTRIDPGAWRAHGRATYEQVMAVPCVLPASPVSEAGLLDFVFAAVWSRPGLSRRNRRWVTLACVCAADTVGPIEDHIYAALKSGDISFDEMQEFVLHFAVYCGWPKASFAETEVFRQAGSDQLRAGRAAARARGSRRGTRVWIPSCGCSTASTPSRDQLHSRPGAARPCMAAGILNFVFGEVWQRQGLTVRDRRFITLACVGHDDTVGPVRSHVYSALKSGDVTYDEIREVVLQFAVYSGWPKASFLEQVAAESWKAVQAAEADEAGERR